jgi:hypothetical protein
MKPKSSQGGQDKPGVATGERPRPGAELGPAAAAAQRGAPELERFVREEAARAVAPYRDLLDEKVVAEMEAFIASALACHPVGMELVSRARPRAVSQRSEERSADATATGAGVTGAEVTPPAARGGKGS